VRARNPSINLVNQPGCTPSASGVAGEVRIANTGSGGAVRVESVAVTIFWQPGGGNWRPADSQSVATDLQPGVLIGVDEERTFTYSATFTAPPAAREFRSVVEVTLTGRGDVFGDTRHFRLCGTEEADEED
jgi:hypothetical protein